MPKKRFLIIIYEKYLLQFILLEYKDLKGIIVGVKKLRVWRASLDFSITDYILQALACWGGEIGIDLVKEMVPIIPQVGSKGVSEIHIYSYKKDDSLYALTRKVYVFGKDVKKQGTLNVAQFINFRNLLFLSLDNDKTSIVRYSKGKKGRINVVAERKSFDILECYDSDKFSDYLDRFSSIVDLKKIYKLFRNISKLPLFKLREFENVFAEYLLNISRLSTFKKCSKLSLNTFGKGKINDNLLVISGGRARLLDNLSLELLSILSSLDLKGGFTVFFDEYGLFDFLQGQTSQIFSDTIYSKLILSLWGNVITIDSSKKAKLDEIVADVDIKDGGVEMQVIPMYGKVLKYTFTEKGDVRIEGRKGFFMDKKRKSLSIKGIGGNLVIDSRAMYRETEYGKLDKVELVKSWLKGIGAI